MKHLGFVYAILLAAASSLLAQAPPVPPAPPLPPRAPALFVHPAGQGSYLGVGLMDVTEERAAGLGLPEPYGVEITSVAEDSPAEKAGLQRGDVVLEYRNRRVEGQEQFVRLVRETPVGREVPLKVLRGGGQVEFTVEIGKRPSRGRIAQIEVCQQGDCAGRPNLRLDLDLAIPKPRIVMQSRFLGAELEPLEGQLAGYFGVSEGILVRSVDTGTAAERGGLQAGDVITAADGKSVAGPGDLRRALREAGTSGQVTLDVVRNREKLSLTIDTGEASRSRPRGGRHIHHETERL